MCRICFIKIDTRDFFVTRFYIEVCFMQLMNPFSIILICIVGYILYVSKDTKKSYINFMILTIVINALYMQGYFLYLGGNERTYDFFINALFTLVSLVYLKKYTPKVSSKTLFWSSLFFLSIFIGLVYFMVDPFQGYVVDSTVGYSWDDYAAGANVEGLPILHYGTIFSAIMYFLEGLLSVVIIRNGLTMEDYRYITNRVIRYLYVLFFYGIFEFFVKNFINNQVLFFLLGNILGVGGSTYTSSMERGSFEALQGFSREPSHYVFSLFLFLVFIFVKEKCLLKKPFSKKEIITISTTFFIMIVSGSFAALIYIFSFLCILAVYKINFFPKHKRVLLYVCLFAVILGGVTYMATVGLDDDSYLGSRINASFLVLSLLSAEGLRGIGGLSSALPRFMSIYETGLDFLDRPLFGVGLSVEACHSGWMTFLSYTGLIGVYLWFKMLFASGHYDKMMIFFFLIIPHILVGIWSWIITIPSIFIVMMFRCDFLVKSTKNI